MRLILFPFLVLILAVIAAPALSVAQSVMENLPQGAGDASLAEEPEEPAAKAVPPAAAATPVADPYTITDVNADVTADTAAHARDQALMQAERAAFEQLCARLGAAENTAKLSDDAIGAMVQSFELQSEKLSAKRYIGVFTIRFKPAALQKKIGKYMPGGEDAGANAADDTRPQVAGPVSHLQVAVAVDSLAAWAEIKRRLGNVPQIARADTIDLGRGMGHIDLSYGGSIMDLENAVTMQGFVLRQNQAGGWELTDNSMVPR